MSCSTNELPILVGGFGEMTSNGGKQYFQQDRVYASNTIAMCHPANIPGGSYRYLVYESDNMSDDNITIPTNCR